MCRKCTCRSHAYPTRHAGTHRSESVDRGRTDNRSGVAFPTRERLAHLLDQSRRLRRAASRGMAVAGGSYRGVHRVPTPQRLGTSTIVDYGYENAVLLIVPMNAE